MYLCTFDATGIQSYVFGSNMLKDNVGASLLVDRALGASRFVYQDARGFEEDALLQAGAKVLGAGWQEVTPAAFFAPGSELPAVLISAAGGNAQVLIRQDDHARQLLRALSRNLHCDMPGLRCTAIITPWLEGSYEDVNEAARWQLVRAKATAQDAMLPDLPAVIEHCAVTGEPALIRDRVDDGNLQWISRNIRARRWQEGDFDRRLRQRARQLDERGRPQMHAALERMEQQSFLFPERIDHIRGRKYEQSYVGVIHIDANGMGQVFRKLSSGPSPAQVIETLREASRSVDAAGASALGDGISWLLDHTERQGDKQVVFDRLHLKEVREGKRSGFPMLLRPIVVAGDELTLVAEGSLALDLAAHLTASFVKYLRLYGGPGFDGASACAGVALGKARAPFSQLYRLAEASCRHAKERAREQEISSLLDYRFQEEGPPEEGPTLSARPFAVGPGRGGTLAFQDFRGQILNKLQEVTESSVRTQLKGMIADFYSGPDAVRQRRGLWKDHPILKDLFTYGEKAYGESLFQGETSPYLDALELLDFAVKLPKP